MVLEEYFTRTQKVFIQTKRQPKRYLIITVTQTTTQCVIHNPHRRHAINNQTELCRNLAESLSVREGILVISASIQHSSLVTAQTQLFIVQNVPKVNQITAPYVRIAMQQTRDHDDPGPDRSQIHLNPQVPTFAGVCHLFESQLALVPGTGVHCTKVKWFGKLLQFC